MPAPTRRRVSRSVVVALVALAGCATGQRPTLVEQTAGTQDAAAREVIERLDAAAATTFTATYEITPTSTLQTTVANVFVSGLRQRIVIGSVDYISDGSVTRTCVSGGGECAEGIDEARISNLQITHDFWGSSMGARLARSANTSLTEGVPRVETIAGQPATCADITVPSSNADASGGALGTLVYCALEAGPLGRYSGADVNIVLTSYAPTVDESQLVS